MFPFGRRKLEALKFSDTKFSLEDQVGKRLVLDPSSVTDHSVAPSIGDHHCDDVKGQGPSRPYIRQVKRFLLESKNCLDIFFPLVGPFTNVFFHLKTTNILSK